MLLFSGTSITVVVQNFKMKQVWVCNCGNAMAVLAYKKGGKTCAEPLTEDHTPRNRAEKERIYLMGGEVRQFQKGDKERVCVRCRNYPGITGTRSIGDLVATKIGVIHEPSMQEKDRNLKDQDVIVIGCEVFWENIAPEEAGELVFLYGSKGTMNGNMRGRRCEGRNKGAVQQCEEEGAERAHPRSRLHNRFRLRLDPYADNAATRPFAICEFVCSSY